MVVLRNSKVEWVVATAFVAAAVLTTAPALAAERPVAGTCFMGECSRYYIVSLDPAMAGSVSVRVRIEHYCTPGDPPDMTAKRCADWRANVGPDWEPLDALYGVKCPPRGWIYYDGNYLAMPQPEVGHATLINAQIWAAVCHRPYPEGWPRPQ